MGSTIETRDVVADAVRRHRALSGKEFPAGDCYQRQCPHAVVLDVMESAPDAGYQGRHRK